MKHIFDINKEPEQIAAAMEEFNEYSDEHARIKVARKKADLFVARVHIGGRGGNPCRNVRRVKFRLGERLLKIQSHFGFLQIFEILCLFALFFMTLVFVLATVFAFTDGYAVEEGYMDPFWFAFLLFLCVILFFGVRTFRRDNFTYLSEILVDYVAKIFEKCPQQRIVNIHGVEINLDCYVKEPVDDEKVKKAYRKYNQNVMIHQISIVGITILAYLCILLIAVGGFAMVIIIGIIEIFLSVNLIRRIRNNERDVKNSCEEIRLKGRCYDACVKTYQYSVLEKRTAELWYEFEDEMGDLHLCSGLYELEPKDGEERNGNFDWVIGKTCKIWYYPGYKVLNDEVKNWGKKI
ncbi:MAG: hypothetical protein ACI4AQ_08110 [Lachnospiraceae bacterium]